MAGKLNQGNLNEPVSTHAKRDFVALKDAWTVTQTLDWLRTQSLGEKIIYFYVVDDGDKLVGVVPTRRLLMSQPDRKLSDIMVQRVISVPETMSVLDACEFFVLYRMLAFPVVDAAGKLVGVIDVGLFTDEIFRLSESQSAQDVFQLIGVHILRGKKVSPWRGFTSRFPWLLCNIGGGIACALLAGMYETFLDSVIVLALFIPVVLALAESVSIQSMTIALQRFHEAGADWRTVLRSLGGEMMTATLLGAACGTIVGLAAWIWKHQPWVALAIGGSIWLAIITACLLGVALPSLVRAVKGNPRIAAGPVVLAAADIATLIFYFNLAGLILT